MVLLNEPAEIHLVKTIEGDAGGVHSGRARTFASLALLAAAVLIVVSAFFYLRRGRTETIQTAATRPADAVKVLQDPTEAITLPPLDETDSLVRQLVRALSTHAVVVSWLTNERLVANFVVVTGRIADGQTPAAELKSIGPIAPFRVRAARGALSVDPASYHRYDRYAQAVSALDAGGVARVYETLKPRINEADRNFGGPGAFDAVLERAIVELLKVPVPDGDVALRPAGIGYAFADPRLEEMSPAQKQLFRMGPDNVRAIQTKLREIASALSIPESRLPRPAPLLDGSDARMAAPSPRAGLSPGRAARRGTPAPGWPSAQQGPAWPPTAASVSGSDALTPKTSVSMTFADASAAIVPAAMPTSAGDMPSTITRRRTSAVRAPSAVLIPISRLRPRTMYESTL